MVVRRLLAAADVAGLLAAFAVTELVFLHRGAQIGAVGAGTEALIFLATLPAWIVTANLYGLYRRDEERAAHSTADELVSVFHLVTTGVWVFFAVSWLTGLSDPDQAKLATFWVLAFGGVALCRSASRSLAHRLPAYVQNTLIVGSGDIARLVARKLMQHPEYGLRLVGFVDVDDPGRRVQPEGVPIVGSLDALPELVQRLDVDRVVVAFPDESEQELLKRIRTLRGLDIQLDVVPRLFEAVGPKAEIHAVEGLALLSLPPSEFGGWLRLVKRALDIVGALSALLLTAPVFLAIALLIKRDSGGPIFFRQMRLGKGMRQFTLLKFRTMKPETDQEPHRLYIQAIMDANEAPTEKRLYKLDRAEAVTPIGRWLRRTSLDELPQLLNVLRGDMSLVGPRPCIPYETDYFAPHHFDRFLVPAGLTGLWQVTARARATFGEALDLDVAYARSWSLGLDLRLLLRTPVEIVRKHVTT